MSEVLVDVNKHVPLTVDDEGLDSSDKKKLSPDVIEMKKNENKMKLEHWISKKYFIVKYLYCWYSLALFL